jgi:hypothetical protein
MEVGNISIIAGTGLMIGIDRWATIRKELRDNSNFIGDIGQHLVIDKTPILSGSLLADITYSSAETPGSVPLGPEDLVYIYAEGIAQQSYWNRIYVPYVEGGPLGLPTYTNDPRLIFLDSATEMLPYVEAWALANIEIANIKVNIGMGVPL